MVLVLHLTPTDAMWQGHAVSCLGACVYIYTLIPRPFFHQPTFSHSSKLIASKWEPFLVPTGSHSSGSQNDLCVGVHLGALWGTEHGKNKITHCWNNLSRKWWSGSDIRNKLSPALWKMSPAPDEAASVSPREGKLLHGLPQTNDFLPIYGWLSSYFCIIYIWTSAHTCEAGNLWRHSFTFPFTYPVAIPIPADRGPHVSLLWEICGNGETEGQSHWLPVLWVF